MFTLTLVSAAGWWVSQVLTSRDYAVPSTNANIPTYTIREVKAAVIDIDGRRKYSLSAEKLEHYTANVGTRLIRPYLIQYVDKGAEIHTTAMRGWLSVDRKLIKMDGQVKVQHYSAGGKKQARGTIMTEMLDVQLE